MLNRRDLIKHFGETLFETTLKKEPSRRVRKYRCLEKGVLKILAKNIQNPVKHLRWSFL